LVVEVTALQTAFTCFLSCLGTLINGYKWSERVCLADLALIYAHSEYLSQSFLTLCTTTCSRQG
jgi:hypothetical protein